MAEPTGKDAIAIVGMSCRFAGCADLRAFWLRILSGEPAFSDSSDPDARRFMARDASQFGHLPTVRGGYLQDLWQASPSAIDLPAAALQSANPEFALASDLVQQALKSAGDSVKSVAHDRIGLIVGHAPQMDSAAVNWVQHGLVVDQTVDLVRRCFPHGSTEQFEALRANLVASLPQYDSRNAYVLFSHAILPLLTEHFDISGPATAVNAGGVSAHLAVVAAVDTLLARRADIVIAGGIQGVVSPQYLMPYAKLGLLSKSDAMHPFGQDADGLLLGEGGGFAVLKRLEDAIRDEDRIFAIIRAGASTAGGNVTKNGASLTALYKAACRRSEIDPASVRLVEGEGSALPAQDKDEVRSIAAVYPDDKRPGPGTVALGTVKGLIGHTGPASGAAGLIKAALSLYHRVIPPSQEAGRPNAQLKLAETPFYLNLSPRPWIHNDQGFPRRAAVTALTFDGYAACLVLEQFRGAR